MQTRSFILFANKTSGKERLENCLVMFRSTNKTSSVFVQHPCFGDYSHVKTVQCWLERRAHSFLLMFLDFSSPYCDMQHIIFSYFPFFCNIKNNIKLMVNFNHDKCFLRCICELFSINSWFERKFILFNINWHVWLSCKKCPYANLGFIIFLMLSTQVNCQCVLDQL